MAGLGNHEQYIRCANQQDIEALAELHVRCWQESYQQLLPQNYLDNLSIESRAKMWRKVLCNPESDSEVVVVDLPREQESDLSGLQGFSSFGPVSPGSIPTNWRDQQTEKCGEIYALYLRRQVQGRGMGKALVYWAQKQLQELGFKQMLLWALSENEAAHFYLHLGATFVESRSRRIGYVTRQVSCYWWPDINQLREDLK